MDFWNNFPKATRNNNLIFLEKQKLFWETRGVNYMLIIYFRKNHSWIFLLIFRKTFLSTSIRGSFWNEGTNQVTVSTVLIEKFIVLSACFSNVPWAETNKTSLIVYDYLLYFFRVCNNIASSCRVISTTKEAYVF